MGVCPFKHDDIYVFFGAENTDWIEKYNVYMENWQTIYVNNFIQGI
jgi:hypothetical protein